MSQEDSKLKARLDYRINQGNLRSLKIIDEKLIDFASNDYLGFAKNEKLKNQIIDRYKNGGESNGSTGSRLLTGNSIQIEALEKKLADIFSTENSLLFGSGYMANMAFFSAVPQKNDIILYDELCHASIKDGCRLSLAKKVSFKHNDLEHLEAKLENTNKNVNVFVAIESVYSMDGDFAPLSEIVRLCNRFSAKIVVDEAHSTGVWGEQGEGIVKIQGFEKQVYARIMTFGKALGIHGACICGSNILKDYLINFSRPFIYTTAPGPFEVTAISVAFDFLSENKTLQSKLKNNVSFFKDQLKLSKNEIIDSDSPIQAIKIFGNKNALHLSTLLNQEGFDVRAILSPTVPLGKERLRICIHAFNNSDEILKISQLLNSYFKK